MRTRLASIVFGTAVGLLAAYWSYQWITDPRKRAERAQQERVVEITRAVLARRLALTDLEIVDPLAPNRKIGKVYVYPQGDGWQVSGYFRRNEDDRWHPYLMALDRELVLSILKVQDTDRELIRRASQDLLLEVSP